MVWSKNSFSLIFNREEDKKGFSVEEKYRLPGCMFRLLTSLLGQW